MTFTKTHFSLCFLLIFNSLFAQERILRLDYFDTQDGLSSNWINSITEDDRGYLWVGTRNGLNIYDGVSNHTLMHETFNPFSLSGNDVSCLLNSKSRYLVAGTWGNGLNIIDKVTKEIVKPKKKNNSVHFNIKALVERKDTTLWVGTFGDGIYKYDYNTNELDKITCSNNLNDRSLFDYCETISVFNDTVWIGSRRGGLGFIGKDGMIHQYKHIETDGVQVSTLATAKGKLLIGTMDGVYLELDPLLNKLSYKKSFSKKGVSNIRITSILSDNDIVWVSTYDGLFSKKEDEFFKISNPNNFEAYKDIFCSFKDSREVCWFGCWGAGLAKCNPVGLSFREINLSSFKSIHVNTVQCLNEKEMISGSTQGILTVNQDNNTVTKFIVKGKYSKVINEGNVLGVLNFNSDSLISLINGKGLFLINKKTKEASLFNHHNEEITNLSYITSVSSLKDGTIWFGTWSNGIYMINPITNENKHFSISQEDSSLKLNCNLIYCAFQDNDGVYWIGTQKGVSYFDKVNGKFVPLKLGTKNDAKEPDLLSEVKAIEQDNQGVFWFASSDGLVSFNKKSNSTRFYSSKDGLMDEAINDLMFFNDELWTISRSGLSKINIETFEVVNFDTNNDGLLPNGFKSSLNKGASNQIYICTGDEIEVFAPEEVEKKVDLPNFFIEKLFINQEEVIKTPNTGKHISFLDEIELEYHSNNISFFVSTVNFQNINGPLFAYKLKGFDTKWILHKENNAQIRYTNLDPGNYVLIISDANRLSENSKNSKTIKIKILSPFWYKWWFVLGSFMLIIFLIYGYTYYRTKSIAIKNKNLEQYVSEKNAEVNKRNQELLETYNELIDKDAYLNSNLTYAAYLQDALQPDENEIREVFKSHFLLYLPKDVVSGDFFWSAKVDGKSIFVVADCTGHGVSGAFISVLGVTFLKTIVKTRGITQPDLILNHLHDEISSSLHQHRSKITDGIDISIICYEEATKQLQISSAMNSVLIVTAKKATRIKGDRFPIGGGNSTYKNRKPFRLETISIDQRTMIYLFTDGFQDQFGGDQGKKFMQKRFRELLIKNSVSNIELQYELLKLSYESWKQDESQVDDILVAGIELW